MFSFEVSEDAVVSITHSNAGSAILHRYEGYPSGELFESQAEAAEWAELFVAEKNNPEAPFAPAARGQAGLPRRLTPEQRKAKKVQSLQKRLEEIDRIVQTYYADVEVPEGITLARSAFEDKIQELQQS